MNIIEFPNVNRPRLNKIIKYINFCDLVDTLIAVKSELILLKCREREKKAVMIINHSALTSRRFRLFVSHKFRQPISERRLKARVSCQKAQSVVS